MCYFNIYCFILYTMFSESHSSMNGEDDYTVLDQATICAEWYRLWSSFGFSEQQWSSRAAKVEEYTRVL